MAYVEVFYGELKWGHKAANSTFKASLQKDGGYVTTINFGIDASPSLQSGRLYQGQSFIVPYALTVTGFIFTPTVGAGSPTTAVKVRIKDVTGLTELNPVTWDYEVAHTMTHGVENTAVLDYALDVDKTYLIYIFFEGDDASNHTAMQYHDGGGTTYDNGNRWKGNAWLVEEVDASADLIASITTKPSAPLTLSANPLFIRSRGGLSKKDSIIFGSEAQLNFISAKADLSTYDDLLTSAYKEWKLIIYEGANVIWSGYVKPANIYREFTGAKYEYNISAVDGLADLKSYDYTDTGTANIITIIKNALTNLDINLGFSIQLGTYSDQSVSTECALEHNTLIEDRFWSYSTGITTYDDCYTVIEKVLQPFNCTLKQSEGRYWIVNTQEIDGHKFTYTWADIATETRAASDIGVDIESLKFKPRGQVQKVEPLKVLKIRILNGASQGDLITNGTFDANVTGWTGAGWESSTPDWTTVAPFGGVMRLIQTDDDNNTFNNSSTISADYGTGAEDLRIEWVVACYSYDGTDPPTMRVTAANGHEANQVGEYQVMYNQDGSFYNMSEVFDMTAFTTDGDLTLTFDIVVDGGTTDAKFYVDNIVGTQGVANTPKDWLHRFVQTNGLETREMDIYFADVQEESTEICKIVDAGTATSTWDRYGDSDTLQLVEILGQQILNDYQSYKNFVKLTIYDPSNTIKPHSVIEYDSKQYRNIGYTMDFRAGTFAGDWIEILNTDVSQNHVGYKLTTINGE